MTMNRRTALSLLVALPVVGLATVPASAYELPMSDRERFERAWAAGHPSSDEEWWYVGNALPGILESKLFLDSILDRWLRKSAQWEGTFGRPPDRSIQSQQDVREVGWLIDVGSALRERFPEVKYGYPYPAIYNRLWALGAHYNEWLLDATLAEIAHADAYFPNT